MPTDLQPLSTTSAIVLTSTGSAIKVATSLPFGAYTGSAEFITGAVAQVAYVYKKLGGDVVDIELTPSNVYAAYEEAVLEYSYIINLHQGKNALGTMLGNTTGTFNHLGDMVASPLSSSLSGTHVALKYPKFKFQSARNIADGLTSYAGMGGDVRYYSASFSPATGQQDYDIRQIIVDASDSGVDDGGIAVDYAGKVNNKRINVTKVFFRSPRAMWRFYGYYGGVGVVGNMSTYGQYSDDSTFEVIPTWQNKMQAIMYEDTLRTRTSNYSYELIDGRLRLFPMPSYWGLGEMSRIWVQFYVEDNAWEGRAGASGSVNGINNINTAPFGNIPYENINAIGKQWIRKYSLALCKEMLGQIRGKFTTIPIPGESVTLNHADLLSQAKAEQDSLRDKLRELLKEMEYVQLAKDDQEKAEATTETLKYSPLPIMVG